MSAAALLVVTAANAAHKAPPASTTTVLDVAAQRDPTQTPIQPQPPYGGATPFQAEAFYGTTPQVLQTGSDAPHGTHDEMSLGQFGLLFGILLLVAVAIGVLTPIVGSPRARPVPSKG